MSIAGLTLKLVRVMAEKQRAQRLSSRSLFALGSALFILRGWKQPRHDHHEGILWNRLQRKKQGIATAYVILDVGDKI